MSEGALFDYFILRLSASWNGIHGDGECPALAASSHVITVIAYQRESETRGWMDLFGLTITTHCFTLEYRLVFTLSSPSIQ